MILVVKMDYDKDECIRAVSRVFDSDRFVNGTEVENFELSFAKFCRAKCCSMVNSGTSALHLALLANGIGKNDEVIIPAFSFVATANVVKYVGAKPVFVDISLDDYTIDPEQIITAITSKTKAIIAVHLYGHKPNMDKINRIAKQNNLIVIEDCAQSSGYKLPKNSKNTYCFSFFTSKNLTVLGYGGAVVTNKNNLKTKIDILRNVGRVDKHSHNCVGFNYRMSEIHAAIGREQLKHLDESIQRRREIASKYSTGLNHIKNIKLPRPVSSQWNSYVIGNNKRDLLKSQLESVGIETMVYYAKAITEQEPYRKEGFPNAEKLAKIGLVIPLYPSLKNEEINFVIRTVKKLAISNNGDW